MKVIFVFGGVSWFGCTSHLCCGSLGVFQLMCTVVLLFPQDLILPNGGTPAGAASPASSSSLLNRLQLDDDMDGETRDLFVTVDDPKKHVCTMETYITYRITTKVGPLFPPVRCALSRRSGPPAVIPAFSFSLPLHSCVHLSHGCGYSSFGEWIYSDLKGLCVSFFFILKCIRNCDSSLPNLVLESKTLTFRGDSV